MELHPGTYVRSSPAIVNGVVYVGQLRQQRLRPQLARIFALNVKLPVSRVEAVREASRLLVTKK